jgi:hypothetical protein
MIVAYFKVQLWHLPGRIQKNNYVSPSGHVPADSNRMPPQIKPQVLPMCAPLPLLSNTWNDHHPNSSNIGAEALALSIHIQGVLGSNLGPKTGYPD